MIRIVRYIRSNYGVFIMFSEISVQGHKCSHINICIVKCYANTNYIDQSVKSLVRISRRQCEGVYWNIVYVTMSGKSELKSASNYVRLKSMKWSLIWRWYRSNRNGIKCVTTVSIIYRKCIRNLCTKTNNNNNNNRS